MTKISNVSFNGFRLGYTLHKSVRLKDEAFLQEIKNILKYAKANNLHKQKNLDIRLDHNLKDGFYAIVNSKGKGVPLISDIIFRIQNIKTSGEKLKRWVHQWNEYFPKMSE